MKQFIFSLVIILSTYFLGFALEGKTILTPELFVNEWSQFLAQKNVDINKIGAADYLISEFNLIEDWGVAQYPRRRPSIQGMDDRDDRWVPYKENKITLSNGTEMSASLIDFQLNEGGPYHNFIATQAPLKNTVHQFWKMVWENAIDQIAMVTELTDNGIKELCYPYWPQNTDDKLVFDSGMEVTLSEESWLLPELKENIQIRKFNVRYDGQERVVTHYWYHNWPDQMAPSQTQTLMALIQKIQEDKEQLHPEAPILAHCAAGVGRTGVFMALYHASQKLASGAGPVNLFELIAQMRWQRPKMVSKPAQYEFCYQFVSNLQQE